MELFTPGHLFVVLIVALVLFFGWKQLPDMARSLGRSLRVFKTEIKGMSSDDEARRQAESERAETRTETKPAAIEAPPAAAPRPRPVPGPDREAADTNRAAGNSR